jgi:hypothetical protein
MEPRNSYAKQNGFAQACVGATHAYFVLFTVKFQDPYFPV